MKNRLFRYISLLTVIAMVFVVSCEKTDIQKANEEYDFDKIVPKVQGVSGPATVIQSLSGSYSVNYFRGGSTWTWQVTNGTITSTSEDTRKIDVLFPDLGEAVVTVTETTLGGITSDPMSRTINVVLPVVTMVGPADVVQTFTYTYSVNYERAGSTWSWSATNATIVDVSEDTREVEVLFTDSGEAMLTVTETMSTGVSSLPLEFDITVGEFCPMTRDDFLGTWRGTETGSSDGDLTVTFIAGAEDNEIVVEAIDGIPAFLGGVFTGWGETFQPGFGAEGDITIVVNENGSLSIGWDYWGQTLPGPYDYWYHGSGLWSGCGAAPTMEFTFNMDWNGDGSTARSNTVELTKDVT